MFTLPMRAITQGRSACRPVYFYSGTGMLHMPVLLLLYPGGAGLCDEVAVVDGEGDALVRLAGIVHRDGSTFDLVSRGKALRLLIDRNGQGRDPVLLERQDIAVGALVSAQDRLTAGEHHRDGRGNAAQHERQDEEQCDQFYQSVTFEQGDFLIGLSGRTTARDPGPSIRLVLPPAGVSRLRIDQ